MRTDRRTSAALVAAVVIGVLGGGAFAGQLRPALPVPVDLTARRLQSLQQRVARLEKRIAVLDALPSDKTPRSGKPRRPGDSPGTPVIVGTELITQSALDRRLRKIEARLAAVEQGIGKLQAALAELSNRYAAHKHTIQVVPYGFITKAGFLANVSNNALVPYIAPHKLKNGGVTPALKETSVPK